MATTGRRPTSALAEVLRLRPFRRLWLVFGLSSLGDWLGLLATSSFAAAQLSSSAAQGAAFGGVIAIQLLPWLVLGPMAGVLADRFDRRHTMVTVDVLRFLLFASIPLAAEVLPGRAEVVAWAAVASFLAQVGAMVWTPAKEAAVPNLLPGDRLETANQLTIVTTYGITPVLAALAFAGAGRLPGLGRAGAPAVALYFDALTFLASAVVVALGVPEISGRGGTGIRESARAALRTGWRYLAGSPLMRGLAIGLFGAFAGAGIVVGAAEFYARSLGGGDSTFALLFAGLFVGFGIGVAAGPAVVGRLSRRRAFGLSVMLAGLAVGLLAAMPRLGGALAIVLVVGLGAGTALLYGVTIIGADVPDAVRGRVFAFLQASARVVLLLSVAAASALAGAGSSFVVRWGSVAVDVSSSRVLLVVAGLCGAGAGVAALRQMDDRAGVALLPDLWRALTRRDR
ncbi:MFS transporter [Actinoplanes sp. KI2]|uniref:MFS transporter n=1 Tax=Actinoplanes sp. KI2 TaxID=2983315 RepID=UPI0021D57F2B|nr:MFS transporter [Actinoplanes sp. KI2]MCU7729447.1 MFS transporter [Actinoplanes sp. KI2]